MHILVIKIYLIHKIITGELIWIKRKLTSMLFIVVFFYTYTGIIGKSIVFVDIASFFIVVILTEYLVYKLMISNFKCNSTIAIIVLAIILICFIAFTYSPPKLEIFKDPVTNQYGISKDIKTEDTVKVSSIYSYIR